MSEPHTIISFDIGIKNLAFCVLQVTAPNNVTIKSWDILDVSKQGSVKAYDIYAVSSSLFDALSDTFPVIDGKTTVVIENQPCMKNPIMKSLQIMVYSYFCLRGKDMNADVVIKLMSAANKLKVKHKDQVSEAAMNEANKYKKNKKCSVDITGYYLKNVLNVDAHIQSLFDASKKKDDLADSFLQAIYFLENTNAL